MVKDAPLFFVPDSTPENQEEVYAGFAESHGVPVPATDKRVYSVSFTAKGIGWIATVGETLKGEKENWTPSSRGGRTRRENIYRQDPATVLAIFPGRVVIEDVAGTKFANPINCSWGNAKYFSVDSDDIDQ